MGVGDDPEEWRSTSIPEIENFEKSFRCGICQDLFEAPVSVAECGHTFCSYCIRSNLEFQMSSASRALDNSSTCPVCRGPASTSTLVCQRVLQEAVESFKSLRGALLLRLKGGPGSGPGAAKRPSPPPWEERAEAEEQEAPTTSGRRRSGRKRTPTVVDVVSVDSESEEGKVEDDGDDDDVGDQDYRAPEAIVETVVPEGKAKCPICGIIVSETFMSNHIDVCLEKQEKKKGKDTRGICVTSSASASAAGGGASLGAFYRKSGKANTLPNKLEQKKIPKLVYHVMKDKELKKYLQQYSLPVHGDKRTQVSRLKEFCLKWNAMLDSGKPVTAREVSRAVMQAENQKSNAITKALVSAKTVTPRDDAASFDQLIEQVRQRKKPKIGDEAMAVSVAVAVESEEEGREIMGPPGVDDVVVPETLEPDLGQEVTVPETLVSSESEVEDSEAEDDFVIPSQLNTRFARRRSSRISSQ